MIWSHPPPPDVAISDKDDPLIYSFSIRVKSPKLTAPLHPYLAGGGWLRSRVRLTEVQILLVLCLSPEPPPTCVDGQHTPNKYGLPSPLPGNPDTGLVSYLTVVPHKHSSMAGIDGSRTEITLFDAHVSHRCCLLTKGRRPLLLQWLQHCLCRPPLDGVGTTRITFSFNSPSFTELSACQKQS